MDDKFDKWSNNGESKTMMYFSISIPSLIRWQAMLCFIFFPWVRIPSWICRLLVIDQNWRKVLQRVCFLFKGFLQGIRACLGVLPLLGDVSTVPRHDMAPITDGKYSVECYLDVAWLLNLGLTPWDWRHGEVGAPQVCSLKNTHSKDRLLRFSQFRKS